jgi:hypothetical protein
MSKYIYITILYLIMYILLSEIARFPFSVGLIILCLGYLSDDIKETKK